MLLTNTLTLFATLLTTFSTLTTSTQHHYNGPKNPSEFRKHCPYTPHHNSRRKIYIRPSRNAKDDISVDLLRGLKQANHGGTLVLPKGQTFVIGKKLDLTFLNNVELNLEGEILFTDDIKYWQSNYYYHPFQKSISYWKWGGKDIRIWGNGTLNGNGQAWYDGFAGLEILDPNNTYLRPNLFYAENATNLYIEGIRFKNSACWTNFVVTSKNVVYDNVIIENVSSNKNLPKNTDGWDSYNVDGLTVRNAWVNIGDDCFSPKPNTSNILVENLYCNGTHGVSMGSIGQYAGVKDYIYNAWIENVIMLNAQNGARLKGWAGPNVGYGYIQNVTFKNFYNYNVDWPIVLDACYFNVNASTCAAYPSRVDMKDIHFQNFTGSSSGVNGRKVAKLTCSPNAVCSNIKLDDIDLTSPKGSPPVIVCDGIQGSVGVACVPGNTTGI
ncbi:Pectin lyase-like protein [Glarea lozoyensis ATCC 20868]|uniref:galacturonan 1,4-alpha-galacturonidase n=1 Tax=Glarea lozoyensis (strain ATCC 20868 / MF5171) TaxID=1116229 RepID=S3DA16_GLAL2|nr:Pectin lyase-like protein [Glarea lozoyensis ATCC 20868]EPE28796.1 Pectin lyase-like protein [Glarea lozoyensis ATCC 20868]